MGYISKEQLKNAAATYLRKYATLPECQGKTIYKIDPKLMAEKVLGLKLSYHKLSLDMSVLGISTNSDELGIQMYDFDGETAYIVIDSQTIVVDSTLADYNIGRYHFTIMHEIAHHIINRYFYNGRKAAPHYYRFSKSGFDPEEWQADVLASYLLMPKVCIERGLRLFDLAGNACLCLYSDYTKGQFNMMSEFLGVSKEALRIRMTELGYLHDIIVEPPSELERSWC